MNERTLRVVLPIIVLALVIACWHAAVRIFAIPPFVLPSPDLVLATLIADGPLLWQSLLVTLTLTFQGFLLAAVGGIALAVIFNQWRLVEYSFYPYAVILQVTPIVAIAPLLLIYLPQPLAVLACAWIVAFFPVLANTTLGLSSVDHNLVALFELCKASRWQTLWNLKLPAALPQMLAGLRRFAFWTGRTLRPVHAGYQQRSYRTRRTLVSSLQPNLRMPGGRPLFIPIRRRGRQPRRLRQRPSRR